MPENWLLPQLTSNYATGVIQAINNKFIDCITLFRGGDGSNLPVNAIRFNGDLNGTFQRWNGTLWANMILGVAGGGTGSDNATGIRDNLGLGTMAVQNSNAVAITGGTIVGLTNLESARVYGTQIISPDGSQIAGLNAANIASGIIDPNRLANGTPNNTVFLRGDSTWAAPAGTLPSGLIAMFSTSCPAGWTRFAALDGRYPRGGGAYGAAGGSYTHSHGAGTLAAAAHTHSAGSYGVASHNHSVSIGYSSTSSGSGDHTHDVSGTVSGTTDYDNIGIMNADAGGDGYVSKGAHKHTFSANWSDTTNVSGMHSHTVSGTVSGNTGNATPAVSGTSGSASPGLSGTTAAANHEPPYLDMVFCQKD